MALPPTAAHALHTILNRVQGSGQTSVLNGWTAVLDTTPDTLDWGRRHGEVVRLHQRVVEQLLALPDAEPARARGLKYAPAWYSAIVWTANWQSSDQNAASILTGNNLDQLEATADHLVLRLAGTSATPASEDISRLRQEIEEWILLVNETTDLPEHVRTEVAGQMRHVLWLLDNAETYGLVPAIHEAQATVGKVSDTVFTRLGTSAFKKKWIQHYGSLLVALGLLSQGLDATNLVLDKTKETLTVIAEVAQEADDLLSEFRDKPKALPSGNTPALEAGTGNDDKPPAGAP